MSPIHFATTSSWKYKQAETYLGQFGINVKQAEIELPESRSEDVLTIAKEKVDYAYEKLKQPVFVIDGAFHIKALNGFPKTLVKFSEKYIGARGVLKLMEGSEDRDYEWPNVLYYRDDKIEKYFIGYIRGTITTNLPPSPKGNGFDLIQLPTGYTKTFSEMSPDDLKHFENNIWQPAMFKEFSKWRTKAAKP